LDVVRYFTLLIFCGYELFGANTIFVIKYTYRGNENRGEYLPKGKAIQRLKEPTRKKVAVYTKSKVNWE